MKETTENEAFQWLFDNASDAIYVLDNQGKFVTVNQKVEEITELRRENHIGKSFQKLIPTKNLPETIKAHKNVLQGKLTVLKTKIKKASGNVVPVEVALAPLEKDNKIIGTLGIVRDITKKNLRKLFTPLFKTKAKGIGMGLAICKRIISVHRGSIDVKSKEGAGTVVTVTIPLREKKDKHNK
ncbi:MAG: PAS domain S-box protein [Candidatus Bathyarchaeota archaeon]|nr:MAG: PAS domain S-box protein [Candidatus Bathyarchaeota archaeon]